MMNELSTKEDFVKVSRPEGQIGRGDFGLSRLGLRVWFETRDGTVSGEGCCR